jgi:hypothetical protein
LRHLSDSGPHRLARDTDWNVRNACVVITSRLAETKTDAAELPDGDSIDGSQKPKQGGQPRQSLYSRYLP